MLYKHGKYKTKLYNVYHSMLDRCLNEKSKVYKHYGSRGIKVFDEWLKDFSNFYNWAIGNGYKEGLSIDRIDVNGNYEPSNCRWVTQKEQNINKRNNKRYTYNSQTKTLTEWCRDLNINYERTRSRIRMGWDFEKAIKEVIKNGIK